MPTLMIGWTTVADAETAHGLASSLVQSGLAACVQVEGPITSYYVWKQQENRDTEYRLMIKFIGTHSDALAAWIAKNHPYENPEWVAVKADTVLPGYLSWAGG